MPTARIAIEFAMIHASPTRRATVAPTMEHATAPTSSDAIGANSDSISAARISFGSSASVLRVWSNFLINMRPTRLSRRSRWYSRLFNALQIASSIGNQDERTEISPATISLKLSGFPDAGIRWSCRDARRNL
jgi:hypothetical protein